MRSLSVLDKALDKIETLLKPIPAAASTTEFPAENQQLSAADKLLSLRLMRVNHAGEIAAQGLLRGQAQVAKDTDIQQALLTAAAEEQSHLTWCAQRVTELHGKTSKLEPLWYWGSVMIGIVSGLCGDKISLGFVKETEIQVSNHLQDHLSRLPSTDLRSLAMLKQMHADESQHIVWSQAAGARELPKIIKSLMRVTSKVMTKTAYWL